MTKTTKSSIFKIRTAVATNTLTRSILWNNVCLDDDHGGAFHNKHFKTWNKDELVGQNR